MAQSFKAIKSNRPVVEPVLAGDFPTKPFVPTFYEWISLQGQQLTFYTQAVVNTNIYLVPTGHTFFITAVTLSSAETNPATISAAEIITCTAVGSRINSIINSLAQQAAIGAGGGGSAGVSNISPVIPIQVRGGEYLRIVPGSNFAHCTIIGYLINNSQVPPIF